ncbi:MAG TPA: hypothetical protein PKK68_06485 [Methanothrix soehngenii]|nr:hypothetical protein [Methanothrix soehngenii]
MHFVHPAAMAALAISAGTLNAIVSPSQTGECSPGQELQILHSLIYAAPGRTAQ